MKYIKKFENEIKEPQLGDYVICSTSYGPTAIDDFMKNNIGQIQDERYLGNNQEIIDKVKYTYVVTFENVPWHLTPYFHNKSKRIMSLDEIIYFSPDKQKLEAILTAKKYNI